MSAECAVSTQRGRPKEFMWQKIVLISSEKSEKEFFAKANFPNDFFVAIQIVSRDRQTSAIAAPTAACRSTAIALILSVCWWANTSRKSFFPSAVEFRANNKTQFISWVSLFVGIVLSATTKGYRNFPAFPPKSSPFFPKTIFQNPAGALRPETKTVK